MLFINMFLDDNIYLNVYLYVNINIFIYILIYINMNLYVKMYINMYLYVNIYVYIIKQGQQNMLCKNILTNLNNNLYNKQLHKNLNNQKINQKKPLQRKDLYQVNRVYSPKHTNINLDFRPFDSDGSSQRENIGKAIRTCFSPKINDFSGFQFENSQCDFL